MRFISIILFVFLCVSLTGCGDGTVHIRGNVTFPDSTPLTKGTIVFASDKLIGKGNLDSRGFYRLNVPPGQYKVYIAFASVLDETFVPPPNDPDALRYVELIHPAFASLETTPLICDISKGGTQNFTVDPPENPNPQQRLR